MNRKRNFALAVMVLALCAMWTVRDEVVVGQAQPNVQVPIFEYDPSFPKPLPEKLVLSNCQIEPSRSFLAWISSCCCSFVSAEPSV